LAAFIFEMPKSRTFNEIWLARDLHQEHISGLEIAVNDALIVGGIQRRGDLPDHVDHCLDRQVDPRDAGGGPRSSPSRYSITR